MAQPPTKLKVAILGGGLAGVMLLRGLLQYDHFDVHIYESRPKFREEGAGISMAYSAVSALRSIHPSLVEALDRAGGVKNKKIVIRVGQGQHAGETLSVSMPKDVNEDDFPRTVYRQAFLTELLAPVPEEVMHAGKRLSSLEVHNSQGHERYRLHFEDGSSDSFDIVFGADGIHGRLRKHVVGPHHPSAEPTPCGVWHLPLIVPHDKAKAALGEWLDPAIDQSLWIGDRTFMMHDYCDGGKSVQLIAVSREEAMLHTKEWKRVLSQKEFKERFSGQMPHLSEGLCDLICEASSDPITAFNEMEHRNTPTYARGRVCILGDAAHSISPSQASGGALSAEDAAILTALLAKTKSVDEVEAAFQIFSDSRRPRAERVAESSNRVGLVFSGSVGTDPKVLRENLKHSWDYIYGWKAEEEIQRVMPLLEQKLS